MDHVVLHIAKTLDGCVHMVMISYHFPIMVGGRQNVISIPKTTGVSRVAD